MESNSVPLTVKLAAPLLGLSSASVYALCAAKKLRHQRVGEARGKILIPRDAIEEYLATGTVGSTEATPTPPPPVARKSVRTFGNLDSDRLLAAWKEQGAVKT